MPSFFRICGWKMTVVLLLTQCKKFIVIQIHWKPWRQHPLVPFLKHASRLNWRNKKCIKNTIIRALGHQSRIWVAFLGTGNQLYHERVRVGNRAQAVGDALIKFLVGDLGLFLLLSEQMRDLVEQTFGKSKSPKVAALLANVFKAFLVIVEVVIHVQLA